MANLRQHHRDYVRHNKRIRLPNGHYVAFWREYKRSTMYVWEGTPGDLHFIGVRMRLQPSTQRSSVA